MLPELMQNLQVGQIIECIYLSKVNDFTKRRLKVVKLNEESFVAYCFLRKEMRTFMYDKILAYRIIGRGGNKCMPQKRKTN